MLLEGQGEGPVELLEKGRWDSRASKGGQRQRAGYRHVPRPPQTLRLKKEDYLKSEC